MQIGKAIKYRTAGNTDFKRRMSKKERQKLKCTHCNGIGHEINECFRLNWYPEWYKELKRGQKKARIHYVDLDMDTVSEGGRSNNGDNGHDIGKIIQTELSKCLGNLMKKASSSGTVPTDVNMI